MTSNVQVRKEPENQALRDLMVREIVNLGCACAIDLAGHIESEAKPDDLVPVLNALVEDGVLRKKKDLRDPRQYQEPCQVIYELAK